MMTRTNPASPTTAAASVTTNPPVGDIRELRPPVRIPDSIAFLWFAAGLAALVVLLWATRRRWLRRRGATLRDADVPPHEAALARLRECLRLIDQPRLFCTTVSDIIRQYIEGRFSLHAPERTTEEFLDELRNSRLLEEHQKQTLAGFLSHCDLVKFARYQPSRTELESLHNSAVCLVEQTEPAPLNAGVPADGSGSPDAPATGGTRKA